MSNAGTRGDAAECSGGTSLSIVECGEDPLVRPLVGPQRVNTVLRFFGAHTASAHSQCKHSHSNGEHATAVSEALGRKQVLQMPVFGGTRQPSA